MAYTIKLKRASTFATGYVLADGELGLELDTQNFKVGDGTTEWDGLGYWITGNLPYTPEDVDNKVSAWQVTPDDTHYPTEKLVKDELDGKQETLVSASNIKTINTYSILGSGNITVTTDPADLTGFVKFTGSTQALNLTGYDITGNIGHFHTITVTSSAAITNLNASKLEGNSASAFATSAHTHATYVPYTGGNSNLNLTGYGVTGTSGNFNTLTITSSAVVTNLNADKLDGNDSSAFATAAHTHATYVPYTGGNSNLNLTGYGVTGTSGNFETLTITSSSVVTNLNADKLDGNDSSAFATAAHTHATYVPYTGGNSNLNLTGYGVTGTSGNFNTLTITSSSVVTNLNADMLDGTHVATLATTAQLTAYVPFTGGNANLNLTGYGVTGTSGNFDTLTVTSSGVVTYLNADMLDGTHAASLATTAQLSSYVPYTNAVSAVNLSGQDLTTTGTGTFGRVKMTLAPTSGYVLTSDASGNGYWVEIGAATYVPYTGANQNVDLSAYALTAGAGRFDSLSLATTALATNLNADLLDGLQGSTYSTTAHTHNTYVPYTGGNSNLNLTGYGVTGTSGNFETLTITSSGVVTNLNADLLDGLQGSTYSTTAHTHSGVYVPYSGANAGIDLNTQSVTAGIGTFGSLTTTGTINASSNVSVSGFVYSSQIRIYNTADMSKELIFQTNTNQLNDLTYTWPDGYGDLNQVLTTNASGGLSWTTASGTGAGGLTQAQVLARTLGS